MMKTGNCSTVNLITPDWSSNGCRAAVQLFWLFGLFFVGFPLLSWFLFLLFSLLFLVLCYICLTTDSHFILLPNDFVHIETWHIITR